jgi:hypothetical protein
MSCTKSTVLLAAAILLLPTNALTSSISHSPAAVKVGIWDGKYNAPGLLDRLYVGQYDDLADDADTRDWILSMSKGFNDNCDAYANDTSLAIIKYAMPDEYNNEKEAMSAASSGDPDRALKALLAAGHGTLGRAGGEEAAYAHLIREGVDDGHRFVLDHGCDGAATKQMYEHMNYLASMRNGKSPGSSDPRFFEQLSPSVQHSILAAKEQAKAKQTAEAAEMQAWEDKDARLAAEHNPLETDLKPVDTQMRILQDSPVYQTAHRGVPALTWVHQGKLVHVTGQTTSYLRVQLKTGVIGFIPKNVATAN